MTRFKKLRLVLKVIRNIALVVFLLVAAFILISFITLPATGSLKTPDVPSFLELKDSTGQLLGMTGAHDRMRGWVAIDRIPMDLIRLVVFMEDAQFWSHRGVDLKQLYNALLQNIAMGAMKYGASTITQQLVKNAYLSNTKSLFRKMQEVMLAFKIEGRLSKQEIMEWYCNIVEMSPGVYGIRAGSLYHFGKEPHQLDFPEMFSLAAILPAPTRFTRQPELLRERMLRVTKQLRHYNRINPAQAERIHSFKRESRKNSLALRYPGLLRLMGDLIPMDTGRRVTCTLTIDAAVQLQMEAAAAAFPGDAREERLLLVTRFGRTTAALRLPADRADKTALPDALARAGYVLERQDPREFRKNSLITATVTNTIVFSPASRRFAGPHDHARRLPVP